MGNMSLGRRPNVDFVLVLDAKTNGNSYVNRFAVACPNPTSGPPCSIGHGFEPRAGLARRRAQIPNVKISNLLANAIDFYNPRPTRLALSPAS